MEWDFVLMSATNQAPSILLPSGIGIFFGAEPQRWQSALVILEFDGRLVLSFNRERGGWEFPGGHREDGEDWIQTATREAWEEAGASGLESPRLVGFYVLRDGHTTLIVSARAAALGSRPDGFEMVATRLFDSLPAELTFNDGVYQEIISHVQRAGE